MLPDVALFLLAAASVAIAVATRVVRPRLVSGPDRVPASRPAWPLVAVMFAAMSAYLFTQQLYIKFRHITIPAGADAPEFSPFDTAVLSCLPPLVGLCVLLLGDRAARPVVGHDLGLGLRRIASGAPMGLLAALVVVPPLFLLSEIVEVIYRALRFAHPTEHPLLHVLGEHPNRAVMATIVLSACLVAPLFEELLFRGHAQTLLRRLFYRMSTRRVLPAAAGFAVIINLPDSAPVPETAAAPAPAAATTTTNAAVVAQPSNWQTWAAILCTSLLFMVVHPRWSWPMIFVLSICLGYAYERTGNLWVSITLHAAFNATSTALFLSGVSR